MNLSPLHKRISNETLIISRVHLAKTQHGLALCPRALTTVKTENTSPGFKLLDRQKAKLLTHYRCALGTASTNCAGIQQQETNTEFELLLGTLNILRF